MGAPGPAPCSYSSCGTSDCVILVVLVLELPGAERGRAVGHGEELERHFGEVANTGRSVSGDGVGGRVNEYKITTRRQ